METSKIFGAVNISQSEETLIIETIRFEKVIKLVKNFIDYNKLNQKHENLILRIVQINNFPHFNQKPEKLLYNGSELCNLLNNLQISCNNGTINETLTQLYEKLNNIQISQ